MRFIRVADTPHVSASSPTGGPELGPHGGTRGTISGAGEPHLPPPTPGPRESARRHLCKGGNPPPPPHPSPPLCCSPTSLPNPNPSPQASPLFSSQGINPQPADLKKNPTCSSSRVVDPILEDRLQHLWNRSDSVGACSEISVPAPSLPNSVPLRGSNSVWWSTLGGDLHSFVEVVHGKNSDGRRRPFCCATCAWRSWSDWAPSRFERK